MPTDNTDDPELQRDLHAEATHRLSEALYEAENRTRRRLEMLSEAVFETDEQHRLVYLNAAWDTIIGISGGACIGQHLADYVGEPGIKALYKTLEDAPTGRTVLSRRRPDGVLSWIALSVARIPQGGLVGVIFDSTAQKLAQDELTKLSLVASSTSDQVLITDRRGAVEWVNQAFINQTGYSLGDMQGRLPVSVLQGPLTNPETVCHIEAQTEKREPVRAELIHYTKTGAPHWVTIEVTPILDSSGEVERSIVIQSDCSAFKSSEAELRQQKQELESRVLARTAELARSKEDAEAANIAAEAANIAKTNFVANMSHDLRTPLNAIIGLSRLCLKTGLSGKQFDYVSKTAVAAESLLHVVSNILDFSKIEANALTLEVKPFSPREVLGRMEAIFKDTALEKGIGFSVYVSTEIPDDLEGDALRFEQVLLNLISNAIKFTRKGSVSVTMELATKDKLNYFVETAISDTGIGFSAGEVERLFQAFSQADNSTTRRYGGSGLGLSISRRLVQKMGGEIVVDSKPGVGSRFAFTVPFAVADIERLEQQTTGRYQRLHSLARLPTLMAGRHILVVEDNLFNQQVMAELMESVGARVTVANSGRPALERLADSGPFDGVLMDIQMPDMDGYELACRIRSQLAHKNLLLIATTANATTEARDRCLAVGIDDFQSKPINPEEFFLTLARWLPPVVNAGMPHFVQTQADDRPTHRDPLRLDLSQLFDAVANDQNRAKGLITKFVSFATDMHGDLAHAMKAGDYPAMGRLAHKLKSSAALLGANDLAAHCEELEAASEAANGAVSQASCQKLIASLAVVREYLCRRFALL